ncbi:sensor histidine kinase [Mucilaginibacter kameinonensis]|uniref:sensor histidine kinase n=1 Tax=Mucilaginibacter kameinonensis TaxID=452286 RepID=UPI0013CEB2C2|nr:histidine kinase dimerization/phosphoacceptor domain -containing protein [Mucilaginibacter kameinonensis]
MRLAWYQVLKPGELKTDLDSAKNYLSNAGRILKQSPSPDRNGFYYLVLAGYQNEIGQKSVADATLERAISYLKTAKVPVLLGTSYSEQMNRIPLSDTTVPKKLRLIQLAAAEFSKTNYKRKLGDCMRLMADLRIYLKDDPQALTELDSAKRLYQEARSGDWQQLYMLYYQYYRRQTNYEKQLENILNALRATAPGDRSLQVALMKHSASVVFYRLKDYQHSLNYSQDAIMTVPMGRINAAHIYDMALFSIRALSRLGRPKEGLQLLDRLEKEYPDDNNSPIGTRLLARLQNYDDLKQDDQAQKYFNTLTRMIRQKIIMEDINLGEYYNGMTTFCINSRQFNQGNVLLNDWKRILTRLPKNAAMHISYLNRRIRLDTARKDFENATRHLSQLNALKDTVYNNTRNRQVREMEMQYQVERRDNENKLQQQKIINLTDQQNLERATLKAVSTTRNIVVIISIFILIIAGLIYRQYVYGRKSNLLIARKNKSLQRLLNENDFLMKEVHHRVKNNLQIVISLLNSQSAYLEEGAALDAILKSKGRVESIALIHQKLYKSDSQSSIYMPEYINELVAYLKDSFIEDQKVWFEVSVDDLQLDVADTVPIGLIINESVTNAIKHAFKLKSSDSHPVIKIALKKTGKELEMTIRDNGSGFIQKTSNENSSFGLLLVKGLTKDLGGKLSIYNDGGTVVQLYFLPSLLISSASPTETLETPA